MSNPVECSDYTVEMISPEDLTDATVTIEYRKPNNTIVVDVTPTNVDVSTNTISYKIVCTESIQGNWKIGAKIVNSAGEISFINPAVSVTFDRRLV